MTPTTVAMTPIGTEELPAAARPEVYEALRVWAEDELRSVNAQIEFLLSRALREAGRGKTGQKK